MNKKIQAIIRKYAIILGVFCLWEALFFALLHTWVRNSLTEAAVRESTVSLVITALTLVLVVMAAVIDVAVLGKILRVRPLLTVQPIACVVEDVVVTAYTSDGEKRYKVFLLVRDPQKGGLLFTYGKHSLSYYNYTYAKAGRYLDGIDIFRKDGSSVAIGDEVQVYLKKTVKVKVSLRKGELTLNGKPFRYTHVNPKYDATVFKDTNFYVGAVDVER